jgi:hypothetical protein
MEARLKKLEKIVERLMRRSHKTAKAMITPYPIANCIVGDEIKGDILKYMFVSSGVIAKVKLWLGAKPRSDASLILTIENDFVNNSVSYKVSRRDLTIEPKLPIMSWDRLTVSLFPIDPQNDKITECWIALEWIPDVKETEIKQALIEELENGIHEEED